MKRLMLFAGCAAALLLTGCSSVTKRLLAEDPLVRAEALEAAIRSGDRTKKKIVARMKDVLADRGSGMRAYAAAALEELGPAAEEAAPELIAALYYGDVNVAGSAERALKKLASTAPALAEALDAKDPALRSRIGRVLAAQGEAAVPALVKNFEGGNKALALESAAVLVKMGPVAEKAVPILARAAAGTDAEVKAKALTALAAIGSPAGVWLAAALRSANPSSRAGASRVLAGMVPPPEEAAEALLAALEDADGKVREHAAMALAAYPPEAFPSLPENFTQALAKAAAAKDVAAGWARTALVRTGRPAGSWLASALKAPDPAAREAAALALAGMSPPPREAALPLVSALSDSEVRVRRAAARALGNYAVSLPSALPQNSAEALTAALKDKDPETRGLAVLPLARLAAFDKKVLPVLISALIIPDPAMQAGASAALKAAGPATVPELWKAFKTRDCRQRALAARALIGIKPSLRKNPAITRALKQVCPAKPATPPEPAAATKPALENSSTTQLSRVK